MFPADFADFQLNSIRKQPFSLPYYQGNSTNAILNTFHKNLIKKIENH